MSKLFRLAAALAGVLLLSVMAVGPASAQSASTDEFPSLTLSYRDRDGAGTTQFTSLGVDPASGGTRLSVVLQQNGRTFGGQGFARQLDRATYLASFWLTDESGNVYVFTGIFVRGFAGWTAEGRYELIGNPGAGDHWTMTSAPCPVC
jgi:hypothetical protein